jgi:hypothetical protein
MIESPATGAPKPFRPCDATNVSQSLRMNESALPSGPEKEVTVFSGNFA